MEIYLRRIALTTQPRNTRWREVSGKDLTIQGRYPKHQPSATTPQRVDGSTSPEEPFVPAEAMATPDTQAARPPNPTLQDANNQITQPTTPESVLVIVPKSFTISECGSAQDSELRLAYNHNIIKILAGLVQILYGSYQLYQSTGPLIEKYGYASYQLTILPYIFMSLINLVAALCEPEFPAMFLVRGSVEDGICGEVGIVSSTEDQNLIVMRIKEV